MDGYAGNMVYVDLSTGTITIKPTPPELKKSYIGGRGFGIRLLTDMVDPKIDPLSDKNILVFAAGPVTGTGIPLGSRYEVSAVSPLTGTAMSGNSGGVFGWKMKKGRVRCGRYHRQIQTTGLSVPRQRKGRTQGCCLSLG